MIYDHHTINRSKAASSGNSYVFHLVHGRLACLTKKKCTVIHSTRVVHAFVAPISRCSTTIFIFIFFDGDGRNIEFSISCHFSLFWLSVGRSIIQVCTMSLIQTFFPCLYDARTSKTRTDRTKYDPGGRWGCGRGGLFTDFRVGNQFFARNVKFWNIDCIGGMFLVAYLINCYNFFL